MNSEIQPSSVKQAEEIMVLLQRSIIELCGPDYGNNEEILNEWMENKTEANIIKWIQSKNTYAVSALFGSKIVGFGLSTINGEILLLYVLPEFKGKGIGKSIYLYIEELLLHRGVNKMVAYSTITAKSFYLKIGFKQFSDPIKVGELDGEFPLEKNITI